MHILVLRIDSQKTTSQEPLPTHIRMYTCMYGSTHASMWDTNTCTHLMKRVATSEGLVLGQSKNTNLIIIISVTSILKKMPHLWRRKKEGVKSQHKSMTAIIHVLDECMVTLYTLHNRCCINISNYCPAISFTPTGS